MARLVHTVDTAALTRLRVRRGLSITALADQIGMAKSSLWRIEGGEQQPRPDILVKIADALDVDIDDIATIAEAVA